MTYAQFVANYNGKSVDFDKVYGAQCVDLILYYLRDCFGVTGFAGNAIDYYTRYPNSVLANRFVRVTNKPKDMSQAPKQGDIVIWSASLPGSAQNGHIAIYDARIGSGVFRSFDQNYGAKYCKFVSHNYGYVIGWLTPRQPVQYEAPRPQIQGDEMIENADQAHRMYEMLRPLGSPTPGEIDATAGKRSYKEFLFNAKAEIDSRNGAINNLQTTINQLNSTVTDLSQKLQNSDLNGQQKQTALNEALAKIVDCTATLETTHDSIVDAQQKAVEVQQAGTASATKVGLLFKIIAALLPKKK